VNRALPTLTVALLLVVAGCSGGLQTGGDEYTESEVVALVTEMDASDARELSTTHRQTLANTSGYRGVHETSENGEVSYTRTVVVDRPDHRFVSEWRDADHGEGEVFANASGTYRRYRTFDNESVQYTVRTDDDSRFVDGSRFAYELPLPADPVLQRYDFEYVRSEDGLYYFAADGLVDPETVAVSQFYWEMNEVVNASARLVVHEDGYVREFSSTVTFDRGQSAETTTASRSMELRAVDDASAEKPQWVDEAAGETE
jgi:hypothetical protein